MGMTTRLGIDDVRPLISAGSVASKAVVGEVIPVTALVWREGHDAVSATLSAWAARTTATSSVTMQVDPDDQDRVHGVFTPGTQGTWYFRVDAWSDPIATWKNAVTKKMAAGQSAAELANDLQHGADLVSRAALQTPSDVVEPLFAAARDLGDESLDVDKRVQVALSEEVAGILHSHPLRDLLVEGAIHEVYVERPAALYSSWYELFPRSTGGWDEEGNPVHGTFDTTAKALERVADMGFDTVYFPPIHPIGKVHRKGKNNSVVAEPGDVGSPWAIQDHSTTHPDLGTMEDFQKLVTRAQELGLEVALDFALQASPDHPWAKSHPEFFTVLPDGTIAYAENPPKKYQDIYPLNFDNAPDAIYHEIYETLMIWVEAGVSTFRVDNPHTKPANFWDWLITRVHATHPDVIFLAEAFTRAPRLFGLAKAGFSQSYTYFTWQTSKHELTQFGQMHVDQADICRPNLFVNTPDILHESLQTGGKAMFAIRAALASTLSPLWGVYSGFELYESTPVHAGSEEYLDSEKYELRPRDYSVDNCAEWIRDLNLWRQENPALQQQRTLRLHETTSDDLLAYSKVDGVTGNAVLVVVNLNPNAIVEGSVNLDTEALGLGAPEDAHFEVTDLPTNQTYTWGASNYVRLDPDFQVAHIFRLPTLGEGERERACMRAQEEYDPRR